MASATLEATSDDVAARPSRRRSTSHLKAVPEALAVREGIRDQAERLVQRLDRSRPFTKDELEGYGRQLLDEQRLDEKFLGFAMVMVANFFWKEQFLAIPFERRMLLLPHCLKHAEGCPAEYDEFGLDCEKCGACSIADYKVRAEELGYKVLVAEGTPIVLKLIVGGYIDGILGVACLNVLEKAIDKVLLAGVPSYAIPLHSGDCKNTRLDESWVWEMLDRYESRPAVQTRSYVPLMRAAHQLFEEQFDQVVPRLRSGEGQRGQTFAPIAETERIALDFLAHGGKRFRPFVTLAAWHALAEPTAQTDSSGADAIELPHPVRRAAVAIEAFHKASLVHDDIEDDDPYRYGKATLHRQYDASTAINVGDYLIGLGYRLVSRDRRALGSDVAADIVDRLSDAHVKLCEGQGAELRWRQAADKTLSPLDAMKIYALKTAPAFEAALYCGLRLAASTDPYETLVPAFSRHLGVGFQILNDLGDWNGDEGNKVVACQDALALRPTLLLALALDAAAPPLRQELVAMLANGRASEEQVHRLRWIYQECDVFEKAGRLVDKSRERAEEIADEVQPDSLRQLLYFLVDTVLADQPVAGPPPVHTAPGSLPILV